MKVGAKDTIQSSLYNAECQALNADNVEYRTADGQVLVTGVSLSLAAGSVCAIAGPNGAGKTTVLNLLSGLNNATSGEILVHGKNLNSLSISERARQMAVVSQQSVPDARLSVRDYVALGQLPIWANYSKQEHAVELQYVLDMIGLDQMQNKPIGNMSGGEQQRAHIARALVQKPQILFLDEPTNHLDPDAKGRILSLVVRRGLTVVMVIHDLVMIPEFASHVALMKDTHLIAFGRVSQVLTPESIRKVFGVDYRLFDAEGRQIPALDIRKTDNITKQVKITKGITPCVVPL